jgi:hypothetical protein
MSFSDPQSSIQFEFDQPWRKIVSAPPGGTVIGLAADSQGRLYLASPAGLFQRSGEGWIPVIKGLPFNEVNAIYGVSRSLFVAGLPAGVAFTTDGGKRWFAARIDQTRQPVTCFTASPRFNRDGVVLAGTHGDGILRSTDGGRYWNLSNFGLRHFEVFALVATTDWTRYERLFAATEGGVYESPNGGRAWRPAGSRLQGLAVLSLAWLPQPDPASPAGGLLFAGTEADGLFRSQDGGQTWQQLDLGGETGPINCLYARSGEALLAGTSALGLLRSTDNGLSWQACGPQDAAALSLAASGGTLYAGLHETGLLASTDGGQTWQADPNLAARRFSLLLARPAGGWLAGSHTAGLWQLDDRADSWQIVPDWPEERPLFALASSGGQVLAASLDGVWRGMADGSGWKQALQVEHGINLLASADNQAWAGHVSGALWRSEDGGASWQSLPAAFQGQALVALAVSPHYETDRTLLAASALPQRQELTFWRSQDGGHNWAAWFKEHTRWYAIQLAPSGEQAAESSFGFGLTVLTQSSQGLRRAEIASPEAPVMALLAVPGSPARIAATGQSLLASLDGREWQPISSGLPEGAAVGALALSPDFARDRLVFALTTAGELWFRR